MRKAMLFVYAVLFGPYWLSAEGTVPPLRYRLSIEGIKGAWEIVYG